MREFISEVSAHMKGSALRFKRRKLLWASLDIFLNFGYD